MTIEVENVDKIYKQLKNKGIAIEFEIMDKPWGDRHFAIIDLNGIGIDIVTSPNLKNDKILESQLTKGLSKIGVHTLGNLVE